MADPDDSGPDGTHGGGTREPARETDFDGVAERDELARFYDLDLLDDPGDLALYLALARRTGGPILELAVGSGRLAVPLAAAGYQVTGVDNDPRMLARAEVAAKRAGVGESMTGPGATMRPGRARSGATGSALRAAREQGSLRLVEGDVIDLRLRDRFGLAILPLNTLLLLQQPDSQLAALRTLAAHLRRDGLAVIDAWLPGPEDLAVYDGRLLLEWVRDDSETGDRVAKVASARFDSATATVTLTQLFDVWPRHGGPLRRVSRVDRLRLVGAVELVRMAADAGLAVEELAGDYQMSAFGPGEDRVILIGRLV